MKRFGLVVIGDEILSGKRADKHMPRVIEMLGVRGLSLSWARYVGDDRAEITGLLRASFASDDVVFCTGGIGATPDDHTRQAAAEARGVSLHLHPEAARLIGERMAEVNPGGLTPEEIAQRMRMGEFPVGCQIIPNPYNKIPGFSLGTHYFVPGFPVMAQPMLEWVLDEHYAQWFHTTRQSERALIVLGSGEAALTPLMEHIESEFPGVKVFSLPSVGDDRVAGPRGGRHIELGVKGVEASLVEAAYAALRSSIERLSYDFVEEGASASRQ